MTGPAEGGADDEVLRHEFIAIATARFAHPPWASQPLADVQEELATMRRWLNVASPPTADGRVRFTERHPELADDPDLDTIVRVLRNPDPADRLNGSDAAVLYVTGHGHVTANQAHVIVLHDTESGSRTSVTALKSADLVEWLTATEIKHLLILLDLCQAGQAAEAMWRLAERPPPEWIGLAAAGADQPARVQALTRAIEAFLAELGGATGEKYAGATERYVKLGDFVRAVQQRLDAQGQQLVQLFPGVLPLSRASYCLPNPNFRPRQSTERDFAAHWDPRSRGVATADAAGWHFTGRDALMAELIAVTRGDPTTVLVTGAAGTGKSAVLARLVTLSNRAFVAAHRAEVDGIPPDLRPDPGAVDAAVLATGRYSFEVLEQLCRDLGVPSDDSGGTDDVERLLERWRDWLARRREPVTIVVDALDEASNPLAMLTSVLDRLDVTPARRKVRLIVGIRSPRRDAAHPESGPDSLAALAADRLRAVSLQVDAAPWWDERDLGSYVARLLTDPAGSPYRGLAPERTSAVATAAAGRAERSFLIAQLAAAHLAGRREPVDASDPAWLATVDEGVTGIFRADLHRSLRDPADRRRVVDLLRAVAFAYGPGLPWGDVWPAVANAVADRPDRTGYTDNDIAWLLEGRIGAYLSAGSSDDTTVYRLFHEALRDMLRRDPEALLEPGVPASRPAEARP